MSRGSFWRDTPVQLVQDAVELHVLNVLHKAKCGSHFLAFV